VATFAAAAETAAETATDTAAETAAETVADSAMADTGNETPINLPRKCTDRNSF
jgi:hypothetical protein